MLFIASVGYWGHYFEEYDKSQKNGCLKTISTAIRTQKNWLNGCYQQYNFDTHSQFCSCSVV